MVDIMSMADMEYNTIVMNALIEITVWKLAGIYDNCF